MNIGVAIDIRHYSRQFLTFLQQVIRWTSFSPCNLQWHIHHPQSKYSRNSYQVSSSVRCAHQHIQSDLFRIQLRRNYRSVTPAGHTSKHTHLSGEMPITNRSLSRLADNLTIPLDNVDSSVGDTLLNSTELCQSYKTCFTCIREASCGWCDSSQNCIPGDIWGPTSDLQCASKWDYMHDMVPHVGCYLNRKDLLLALSGTLLFCLTLLIFCVVCSCYKLKRQRIIAREYIRIVSDDVSDPFFSSSFESLHSPPQHSLPHSNLSLSTSSRSSKPPLPSRDKSSFSHSHPQFNNTHHTTTYGSIAGTTPFNIRNNRHESKTSIGRWDSSKTIWNGSPSNGHSNWSTTEQGDVYGHSSSSDYDKGKNGVSKYLIGEKWSQKRQELLSRYQ